MAWVKRVLGLVVAVAIVAGLPGVAFALTTTIRENNGSGVPYAGKVRFSLVSNVSLVFFGTSTTTCTQSTLEGPIQSNGTSTGLTGGTFTGTGSGGTCTGPLSATVTVQSLPWPFTVAYSPGPNGRDFAFTIGSAARIRLAFTSGPPSPCVYGGPLVANGYNPSSSTGNEALVTFNQIPVTKVTTSPLCPALNFSATYMMKGESVPLSGVFDRTLFVGP